MPLPNVQILKAAFAANQVSPQPFPVGILAILAALLMTFIGIIMARIASEFVLIVFRINEHLGAIRNQGEPQYDQR